MNSPYSLIASGALEDIVMLAKGTPPGCFVEVGVYQGGSAWHLLQVAKEQERQLHLFDTFTGIPVKAPIDTHKLGDYGDVSLDSVKAALDGAVFHVGIFPGTLRKAFALPRDYPPPPEKIAFVHVDCDQYDSITACIDHLFPLMVKGGIMLFDDCYSLPGATAAVEGRFPDKDIHKAQNAKRAYVFK